MTQIVFTLGYSGKKMHEIEALVKRHEAILFDIRFSPYSRAPMWNQSNFQKVFGGRYRHIKTLGNINYKSGGPIQIADFDAGVKEIKQSGRPVILMCACKDYHTCHRRAIADRLRLLGFQVSELDLQQERGKKPDQPLLL